MVSFYRYRGLSLQTTIDILDAACIYTLINILCDLNSFIKEPRRFRKVDAI
jgi:hypothetical protein